MNILVNECHFQSTRAVDLVFENSNHPGQKQFPGWIERGYDLSLNMFLFVSSLGFQLFLYTMMYKSVFPFFKCTCRDKTSQLAQSFSVQKKCYIKDQKWITMFQAAIMSSNCKTNRNGSPILVGIDKMMVFQLVWTLNTTWTICLRLQ